MSYRLTYLGPTQTFKAAALHPQDLSLVDISLEQNQIYTVEVQQDGPTQIFNGTLVLDPNTTLWIIFHSLGGRIPYSPEAVLNHWRLA